MTSSSVFARHDLRTHLMPLHRVTPALTTFLAACVVFSAVTLAEAQSEVRKPNVIVILADDQGYGDLGRYGSKDIATPNIDRLCAEGMKFTADRSADSPIRPLQQQRRRNEKGIRL